MGACGGGGKHTDSYEKAQSEQQACCDNLTGADRDECHASLVTVDDPTIADTKANRSVCSQPDGLEPSLPGSLLGSSPAVAITCSWVWP